MLRSIDHRGYPAYKSLAGSYDFGTYALHIVHVQGDPFAAPSDLEVSVKAANSHWPAEACSRYETRVALQDMILRRFSAGLNQVSGKAGGSRLREKRESERQPSGTGDPGQKRLSA